MNPAVYSAAPDRARPGGRESAVNADWYYEGDKSGDRVGHAVGSAGDVNSDGYDDAIVGAPKDTYQVGAEGVAYIFHGSSEGLEGLPDKPEEGIPSQILASGQKGSEYGTSVGTAGNVNGDAYDDVIVGAPEYNNGITKVGAAFVYYGSESGLNEIPAWSVLGSHKDAQLGYAVSTAGDVNGDEFDDVVVGARWYSNDQTTEGAVLVYYGSESGLSDVPDWTFESDQAGASLGTSVRAAGDVNRDGYDDVIAGAPLYTSDQEHEGAAFLFFGSETGLISDTHWVVYGGQAGAQFGLAVSTAGDVDDDGYDDVVVGAPMYDDGEVEDAGAAFVFLGSNSGPSGVPDWSVLGGHEYARLGYSVGSAGDVNGDVVDDLIVGADQYQGDEPQEGAAFVFYGSAGGLGQDADWTVEGDKANAGVGSSVGTAGNVDGTGSDDLIVGAPTYRHETDLVGRALVFYGTLFRVYVPVVLNSEAGR